MPKTDHICIIGAGPGGLAVALALKEAGYSNITVYEKTNHIGGQVFSKKYLAPNGKEITYEQCALQPMGSPHLNRIIKRYGLHYARKRNITFYSLADQQIFFKFSLKYFLSPYLFIETAKLAYILFKHRYLWKPGFENFPRNSELAMPLTDWVDQQKFRSVIHILLRYAVEGFVSFQKPDQNIPTCYGFKFLLQMLKRPIRYINGVLKQIEEGYQEIWERVARDLSVQCHARISQITRTDNVIRVTVNGEVRQFDKLIIACQEYADFLDCTEDEKIVQAQRKTVGSLRAAFIAKITPPPPPLEQVFDFPDTVTGKRRYQCAAITQYGQVDQDLYLFTGSYVLPEDAENLKEEVIKATKEVLSIFNGELIEVISMHKQPNYCGHFSTEAIREGIFERSEARQGVKNTYYVGEMLSFGTCAIIVDYAYALVKRFF